MLGPFKKIPILLKDVRGHNISIDSYIVNFPFKFLNNLHEISELANSPYFMLYIQVFPFTPVLYLERNIVRGKRYSLHFYNFHIIVSMLEMITAQGNEIPDYLLVQRNSWSASVQRSFGSEWSFQIWKTHVFW